MVDNSPDWVLPALGARRAAPASHGDQLAGVARSYAAMGWHHTGSDVDRATTTWLSDLLAGLGGRPRHQPYIFPRFEVDAELYDIDGEAIECAPLWYSRVGHIETGQLDLVALDRDNLDASRGYDALATPLPPGTEARVVVVGGTEQPVMADRSAAQLGAPPTVFVAARDAHRLGLGSWLRWSAAVGPARSANVEARFPQRRGTELIIAFSSTGWYGCASERGGPLAIGLALANALAAEHSVRVVATSGAEIGDVGLRHWLGEAGASSRFPVICLGRSIGAAGPATQLARDGLWIVARPGQPEGAPADRATLDGASTASLADPDLRFRFQAEPPEPGQLLLDGPPVGPAMSDPSADAVRARLRSVGAQPMPPGVGGMPSAPPRAWMGEPVDALWATVGRPLLALDAWSSRAGTVADRADAVDPDQLVLAVDALVDVARTLLR